MPQDQFSELGSPFDVLLGDDAALDDPVRRQAMAAKLRKQNAMGIVGQLMGVQPTQMAGQNLQGGAENSLKLAMTQRQALQQAKLAAEQEKRDQEWKQRNYDRGVYEFDQNQARLRASGSGGGLTPYQQETIRARDEAAAAAREARLNADAKAYGADVSSLGDLQSAIAQVDEAIAPYRESGDIPGVGGLSNAPGFLGTVAAKFERGGTDVRNAVQPVKNLILKARSGGAVTPQEGARLETEFNTMMGASDADFLKAWDRFKTRNQEVLNRIESSYTPEAVNRYKGRGQDVEQQQRPQRPGQTIGGPAPPVEARKTVNGQRFIKVGGKWYGE